MNVLIVVGYNPFVERDGNAIRVRTMLRELVRNGHKISLLMYVLPQRRGKEMDFPEGVKPYLFTVRPELLFFGFFLRRLLRAPAFFLACTLLPPFYGFKKTMRNIIEKDQIDIVQCENTSTASQVERSLKNSRLPVVVTAHDVVYDRYLQLVDRRLPKFLARFFLQWVRQVELNGVKGATICACVSGKDEGRFVEMGIPAEKLVIIPNGVDCEAVAPTPKDISLSRKLGLGDSPVLLFGGSDQPQNKKAVDDIVDIILPATLGYLPNVKMVFTGTLCRYVAARKLQRLYPHNIISAGYVEELRNYYSLVDIVLLPITIGSGTKLKAAEAFAAGKPIISTSLGVKGYDVVCGEDLIIEDDLNRFPEHIVTLLNDVELRCKLSSTARENSKKYDWRTLMQKYDDVYSIIINGQKQSG